MSKKNVVVVGAGPCGLAALKEMLEAGHSAVALEKGPGIGGVFCRTHDTQYENLYLTISNMLMSFSDFPPEDMRIKYSSKNEYGAYLDAYADKFGLRPHIRLSTEVTRATHQDGRWRITTRSAGAAEPEVIEADALLVATGSNHVPRRLDTGGFTGEVLHSSEYHSYKAFAGKRVLIVGSGESAFDIGADIAGVAAETIVWARSPISAAPRFPGMFVTDPAHDELEILKDEAKWGRAKVSDFLEVMTVSRMANAAPMWAYSSLRHAIWAVMRGASPAGRRLSAWCRQSAKDDALRGDQASVPTKNARICTEAARGKANVIIARTATFSGRSVAFADVIYEGNGVETCDLPRETRVGGIDVVMLCTGYRTDFSWIELDGLDWNPRTWFKHCFPKGHGDKLMFLGWARPHQGGIPACAEILSRYIAMLLDGTRTLPADYAERAMKEGGDEHEFYRNAQHSANVVDYPAFMDSVARLVGCLPEPPKPSELERLLQYWVYPNWPFWYRKNGPRASPELVEAIFSRLPLTKSFALDPLTLLAFVFSLAQAPIGAVMPRRSGLDANWAFKAKKHILHDNV